LSENTKRKRLILLLGGADKGVNTKVLANTINKYVKKAVFLEGTGTDRFLLENKLKIPFEISKSLKHAINLITSDFKKSLPAGRQGDILLFSPAFASFGMFKNEYDRNDQFVKIIKGLI
jgi:UDP-N-acetylmuramoylalanine--D-glutamate ligase